MKFASISHELRYSWFIGLFEFKLEFLSQSLDLGFDRSIGHINQHFTCLKKHALKKRADLCNIVRYESSIAVQKYLEVLTTKVLKNLKAYDFYDQITLCINIQCSDGLVIGTSITYYLPLKFDEVTISLDISDKIRLCCCLKFYNILHDVVKEMRACDLNPITTSCHGNRSLNGTMVYFEFQNSLLKTYQGNGISSLPCSTFIV